MNSISKFHNAHKGKTMLLVGNGENLHLTPPEQFDYPSIGMNTIHLYDGWMPDYYLTVDRRVQNEFGKDIDEKFKDIPIFLPHPRLMRWTGQNKVYFKNMQGLLWPKNGLSLWQDDFEKPLIYGNSMHVAIKLAYWMGAKTILVIGMEHKPHKSDRHFWGDDAGMSPDQPTADWIKGYKVLCDQLSERKVRLINVSQDTFVPADIIPQDSWENWLDNPAHEREEE